MSKLLGKIKYFFARERQLVLLQKENKKLQSVAVDSVELVSDYKNAMNQMREFVNQVYQHHLQQYEQKMSQDHHVGMSDDDDPFGDMEEEDFDQYQILRKKITVH